jgi:predicted metal-dependent peptidase
MNNDDKKDIEEVRRIFSSLALLAPFTYPLISWPIIINRSPKAPLAAINGVSVFICIEKWGKLNFREKLFVALHEWLHIALLHSKRLRTRKHRTFNYAADFAINAMILQDLKQFEMPTSLYDPYYKDQSAEQIYKDLDTEVKKRQEQKITPFCHVCHRDFHPDDEYCDDDDPCPKCPACNRPVSKQIPKEHIGPIDRELAINQLMVENFGAPWGNDLIPMPQGVDEQKIIDEVIKAAARHKGMGRGLLPGFYEDYVEQIKKSEVPFERVLIRFAKECLRGHSDRNPYRPDPKYLPFDIFIPREQGTSVPKIVLIVDTSGSMNSVEFECASGHLQKLGSICDNLILMTADTKVHEVIRVKSIKHELKKRKVKFIGRGGTDMHDAFARADKLRPSLIILYSDMDIGNYPPKPKAPVIFLAREHWAKHARKNPYGVFIIVKDQNVT